MNFIDLEKWALKLNEIYARFEIRMHRRAWTSEESVFGFVRAAPRGH
jgi:hypothetical protein